MPNDWIGNEKEVFRELRVLKLEPFRVDRWQASSELDLKDYEIATVMSLANDTGSLPLRNEFRDAYPFLDVPPRF